jgi:hypothetical protein
MPKRTLHNYFENSRASGSTPHTNESTSQPKKPRAEFNHSILIADPGNRKPIDSYESEIRDQLKRAYALSGPTQSREFSFPRKWIGGEWRSFQKSWFDEFDWLEYSESKDAAYCLYCYLFFNSAKSEKFGEEKRYEIRLTASLDVARFLISQGEPFRGDDESSTSLNKGTFREMVDWYKHKVEIVKDAYEKGSKNCQMLSHFIQKDLTKGCAEEVTTVIMDEIRGRKFSVLIDESRDISIKEQMAMILRSVLHNSIFTYILHIISKIILTHKQMRHAGL